MTTPSISITALIRTHPGREELTKRAILSAESEGIAVNVYQGEKVNDFSYNLYSNTLKEQVQDGYFFFLDSDDVVIPGAVEAIKPLLIEDQANIIQMLRNGQPKPLSRRFIQRGCIGGPCLILHSKYKAISDWTAEEAGDWLWVEGVIKQLPINFISIPLVNAGKRSHGK